MIIDAHQHFWNLGRSTYSWLGPQLAPIDRTIEYADLVAAGRDVPIDATVLVQSDDTADDTAYLLEVAAQHPRFVGVVAWVPLDDPDTADRMLTALRDEPVVGVRSLIHDRADPDWIVRPEVLAGLDVLSRHGLPFDFVSVLPEHLRHVPTLTNRLPELVIVIDHLSKPPIGVGSAEPWSSQLAAAAESPNVVAKVSGLYPATGSLLEWDHRDVQPWFDRALELFGPDRLMFGSDWPVAELAGGLQKIWHELSTVLATVSDTDRAAILGRTANRVYSLGLEDPVREGRD